MIEGIVGFGLGRPLLGAVFVIATAVFGFLSMQAIPKDVFPDLSTPVFNLIVQDASMAPEELESAISIPFESALQGVPGVRRVRSQCALGVAQITVEFYTTDTSAGPGSEPGPTGPSGATRSIKSFRPP